MCGSPHVHTHARTSIDPGCGGGGGYHEAEVDGHEAVIVPYGPPELRSEREDERAGDELVVDGEEQNRALPVVAQCPP